MKNYIITGTLVAVLLTGVAVYELFFRHRAPQQSPRTPLVRTVEIVSASELETKSYPGVAKEAQTANLSFRVPGKLIDSDLLVGVRFEKDEMIARLDPRDYELAVARFEAELEAAQSLLAAMKTGARPEDLASVRSQLVAATSAFETADANLKRFTALLEDQVASQAQFDLIKTQYDTAKGQKETLENELEKAKTGARKEDVDAMEAKILGLQASLNTARNALDDTRLRAPFTGITVEKFVEDHSVVAPGMPVVSFVNVAQMDVAVSLPEEMIVRLDDIRGYRVVFESYPDRVFPAKLKELGRAIQRGRQTYPLQVRVDLSEQNALVFPGMTATVLIDLARNTELPQTVPLAALVGKDDQTAVWVVKKNGNENSVERRGIRLLRIVGDRAEIESDLEPGERIVCAGARFLTERQRVRLEEDYPRTTRKDAKNDW